MLSKMSSVAMAGAFALGLFAAGSVFAQDGTGGVADGAEVAAPDLNLSTVSPAFRFSGANIASGGVGLRNRASGAIELGGVDGDVRRAYLYWNIVSNGTPPEDAQRITVQRVGPDGSDPVDVIGEQVGQGATPCWGGNRNTVYRARVPNAVINGAGTYLLTVPAGVPGLTDGTNPWESSPLPAYNGASLVVVYDGSGDAFIYDQGLSGNMFQGDLNYSLRIPPSSRTSNTLLIHMINSDGQRGTSNFANDIVLSRDTTNVNGVRIAGRNSLASDSNMNGAAGGVVAQLWDNDIQQISGRDRNVRVRLDSVRDCVVAVVNAVDIPF